MLSFWFAWNAVHSSISSLHAADFSNFSNLVVLNVDIGADNYHFKKTTASPEEEALYGPAPVPVRPTSVSSKNASNAVPIGSRPTTKQGELWGITVLYHILWGNIFTSILLKLFKGATLYLGKCKEMEGKRAVWTNFWNFQRRSHNCNRLLISCRYCEIITSWVAAGPNICSLTNYGWSQLLVWLTVV